MTQAELTLMLNERPDGGLRELWDTGFLAGITGTPLTDPLPHEPFERLIVLEGQLAGLRLQLLVIDTHRRKLESSR